MLAPRLDFVDVEFRFDENHEILQVHLRNCGGIRLVVGARDNFSEGIRRDGNPVAGQCRKLQVWTRIRGGWLASLPATTPPVAAVAAVRAMKMPSSDRRQSGASLSRIRIANKGQDELLCYNPPNFKEMLAFGDNK